MSCTPISPICYSCLFSQFFLREISSKLTLRTLEENMDVNKCFFMLLKLSSWFMIMVSIFSFWEFSSFFFCSWRCFQFLLSLVLSWQPLEYAVAPHQPHPQHQQSHHQSLSFRVSKRSDRIFTYILLCPCPVTSFAIKHFSNALTHDCILKLYL